MLIGALVPGTGDPNNGLVLGTDTSYPKGFRNAGAGPASSRGSALAYDLTGDGKTALRGSSGIFHNTRVSGNVNWQASRNPPLQLNPQIFYGTMDTLLQSTGSTFPSTVQGFDQSIETPTLYSYTAGVQRDIGWHTVVDAAYVGSQTHPPAADGQPERGAVRRALRRRRTRIRPRPGNPLPDNFFRPYPGLRRHQLLPNNGIADYNALQVQANRRFTHGLQFGVAYTLSRSRDYTSATETGTDAGPAADLRRRPRLDLRPFVVRPDARRGHQLHLGSAEGEHAVERRDCARRAR